MPHAFLKSFAKISVMVAVLFTLGSCRTAPIYNADKISLKNVETHKLSQKQVEGAILKSCEALRWRAKVSKPGVISAIYQGRGYMAVVEIPYDSQQFSIIYKESENLNENGGMIHKNYNVWVQNLEQRIRTEIAML